MNIVLGLKSTNAYICICLNTYTCKNLSLQRYLLTHLFVFGHWNFIPFLAIFNGNSFIYIRSLQKCMYIYIYIYSIYTFILHSCKLRIYL